MGHDLGEVEAASVFLGDVVNDGETTLFDMVRNTIFGIFRHTDGYPGLTLYHLECAIDLWGEVSGRLVYTGRI